MQAKAGKADLSNIQMESLIIYLAKQKFLPVWTNDRNNANVSCCQAPAPARHFFFCMLMLLVMILLSSCSSSPSFTSCCLLLLVL